MKNIILSRTDSLGDVVLTLPMAGMLKNYFPGCRIIFLGKAYTRPLIEACCHVDLFVDWDEIVEIKDPGSRRDALKKLDADAIIHVFPVKAICRLSKEAGIPLRISTSHRWFSWLYCNKLVHFSRRKSVLHEAQLNLKLLEPLGIKEELPVNRIAGFTGLTGIGNELPLFLAALLTPDRFNLILHPKSKGSAREWGINNFSRLVDLLPPEKFRIFITGTKEEGPGMKDLLENQQKRVIDLTGKLSLPEFLVFINQCDGLIAASTGPLHIAAALGKKAIGLYAPMRPIFPQRWAPLGEHADYLVLKKSCNKCRHTNDCECIRSIKPEEVVKKLM